MFEFKVIQQYQIELFGAEVDLSDTNQQRGRRTQFNSIQFNSVYSHFYKIFTVYIVR